MNIQVTDPNKYKKVKKVQNYGACLRDDAYVDGHLSIVYIEDGILWTSASFGAKPNSDLEKEFGFRFVTHENHIDNSKYYN